MKKSPEKISEKLFINKEIMVTIIKNGMATFAKEVQNIGCFTLSKKLIILIFDCCDDDRDRVLF